MSTKNEHEVEAYPLQWPVAVPRTRLEAVSRSAFGQSRLTWNLCLVELRRELNLLGASRITISTNQPLRRDGNAFAQARRIDDAGVAVYFMLGGEFVCFPCDRWATIPENVRAITLHIGAMRGQTRWGVGTAKQAFAGYKALPASVASTEEDPWTVLGIPPHSAESVIRDAHRRLALSAHPDRNGSDDRMIRINRARDNAMAARKAS